MQQHDIGVTLWLTGLSGAGKTTISHRLAEQLRALGRRVEILDGDVIREHLSRGLGFTREDRNQNIQRIAYVAGLLSRNGVIVITAAISPYRETRQWARNHIDNFVEVFVDCPLEVCAARDVKGLYAKALAGEIPMFTGVSDPYEPPLSPELTVRTHEESVETSTERIVDYLYETGWLRMSGPISRIG